MDDIERLLNAAITTQWTLSPALVAAICVVFTTVHNKLRGRS
jgi:hypothetical protein